MSSYEQTQRAKRAVVDQVTGLRLLAATWVSEARSDREAQRELELIAIAERRLWDAAEALRLVCAGTLEKMRASV